MRFKKSFIICFIFFIAAFVISGCSAPLGNFGSNPADEPEISEEEIEYTEDYYDRLFLGDVVTEEEKRENIFSALTDININTEFIKDFSKAEDETGTEKYTFTYRNNPFTVYMNPDSTVSSVRIGDDGADVYLEGYEPYDAEDYIMTESQIQGFQSMMVNAVEISFDYPQIYEFGDDWNYIHEGDFFYTGGSVFIGEAKTAHTINLTYYYDEIENTMYWYSLKVDGEELSLPKYFDEPVIPERKPLP